jgi:hypothetical protein
MVEESEGGRRNKFKLVWNELQTVMTIYRWVLFEFFIVQIITK